MKALLPVAIALLLTACTLPGSTPPASISVATTPIIVTQDNYAQAYTNMRFAAIQKKRVALIKYWKCQFHRVTLLSNLSLE